MTTRVVNVCREDFDVWIGPPVRDARDARCRVRSRWWTPYRPGPDCSAGEAIHEFELLMRRRLASTKRRLWFDWLAELRGKRLGCTCKPAPCHGDVLVALIEELDRDKHDGAESES